MISNKILITLMTILVSAPGFAGFDSGNAGDAFSAEFLFSGRDILQRLELIAANGKPLMETANLRKAMETTVVASEERVYLDGIERDAVNYPSKKLIKISRTRWKDLRQAAETSARLTLVLHEFLWMSGVDDTNFVQTQRIIEALKIPPYSPSIWLNVPGRAFAVVECAGKSADGSLVTVLVNTKGVTKAPDHGEVQVQKAGNKFGYRFGGEVISQFFENDDAEKNWATVGLGAYIQSEFPVNLKYDGPNYVDQDLGAVLESGAHSPGGTTNKSNYMRVWKGPGYLAKEIYVIENPVCSVGSNN